MSNNKKKNVYRYFIYNMQEYLKSDYDQLESRTIGSFRALLLDYFELYAEINSCTGDKGKYQKSLDNLLNSIIFYCSENPISRHPHITSDIQSLKKLLEQKVKSEQNEKSEQKLHDFFGSNIIIQRKIAELNCILNNPQQLKNLIEYTFSRIQHDLNSIYRLRNKLVHSGVGNKPDIELYTNKLQKYVNCVLGTIIYHIMRSPESTISEVLYSIVQTYDNYLDILKDLIKDKDSCNKQKLLQEKIMKIAFPPYLYL